jgi:hypothetical protein
LGELTPDECDLGQTQFAGAPVEAELQGSFGSGQQGELLGDIGRGNGGGVGVLSHGGMMHKGCDTVCGDAAADMSNPAASQLVPRTVV